MVNNNMYSFHFNLIIFTHTIIAFSTKKVYLPDPPAKGC